LIQGNFIGTSANGTSAIGNYSSGVYISGSPNNTIGGTTASARNIISGGTQYFGAGVTINGSSASGNTVQGNYIGTDVNGTTSLANSYYGIQIADAPSNTIGGTDAAARNIISGNGNSGINISGNPASGNTVQGNFIGTAADGS